MALADYYLCDVCKAKTFYDANVNYCDDRWMTDGRCKMIPNGAGDMAVLCMECAKTHKVIVTRSITDQNVQSDPLQETENA